MAKRRRSKMRSRLRVRSPVTTRLRSIRVVSLVETKLTGHSVLPVLASDALLLSADAALVDASSGDGQIGRDGSPELPKCRVAARALSTGVGACVDRPGAGTGVGREGGRRKDARGGERPRETPRRRRRVERRSLERPAAYRPTSPRISFDRRRSRQGIVSSIEEAGEILDLASIAPVEGSVASGEARGSLLEIARFDLGKSGPTMAKRTSTARSHAG